MATMFDQQKKKNILFSYENIGRSTKQIQTAAHTRTQAWTQTKKEKLPMDS